MQGSSRSDPLETVRSALVEHGLAPSSGTTDFRSACPAHGGESSTALHVSEGVDGCALLHCFRGCAASEVVAALGLSMRDLFPPGHRKGWRRQLPAVQRHEITGRAQAFGRVLAALERTHAPWTAMLCFDCPACGSPGAWLRSTPGEENGPVADCPRGCRTSDIASALAARVLEVS